MALPASVAIQGLREVQVPESGNFPSMSRTSRQHMARAQGRSPKTLPASRVTAKSGRQRALAEAVRAGKQDLNWELGGPAVTASAVIGGLGRKPFSLARGLNQIPGSPPDEAVKGRGKKCQKNS